jgi:tape measure domain-containing protein
MADEKRLQLVIDPSRAKSGAKVAKDAVLSVEAAADKATKALAKLERAILLGSSPLDKLNKAIGHVVNVNQKMLKSINDLSAKLDGVNTSVRNGAQGLTNWEKSLERAKDKTAMLNSELGRQLVAEKQLHAELTKQIKFGSDRINQLSAQEMAQKKLADSVAFWTQRTKDLNSEEYKSLVQMREKARQLEAYEKSMVDGLSTTQKAAKAENELRKAIERGKIELDQYENGLAQKNIEMQESIAIQRRLAQSEARLKATMDGTYDTIIKNEAAIRKYKRELLGLEDANKRASRGGGFSTGANALTGALGVFTGGFVVAELVRVADAYTNIQNRLAVVTDGTTDLTAATRELLDVSINSRTSLDTTMDVYTKMIRVTKDMTFANEDLLRITETVSKAVAMSGASAQGAEGALLQFSQALSGDFQAAAQELNSIIEQTPAVAQLMADALNSVQPELNASIGNLKRLATEGQISTEMLLKGILKVSSAIDTQFENSIRTVSQSLTALKGAFTVALGEVDRALGGTNSLAEAIVEFATGLGDAKDELAGLAAGLAAFTASAGLGTIISLLTQLTPVGRAIAAIAAALGALIGVVTKYQVEMSLIEKETEDLIEKNKNLKASLEGLVDVYAELSAQQLLDEFNKQQKEILDIQNDILKTKQRIEEETTYDAAGEFVRISGAGQKLLRQLDSMNQELDIQEQKLGLVRDALQNAYGGDVQAMLQAVWDKMRGIVSEETKRDQMQRDISGAISKSQGLVAALEEELRVMKLSNVEQVQAMIYMEAYNALKDKSIGGTREFIDAVMDQVEAYLALQGEIDRLNDSQGKGSKSTRDWAAELKSLRASLDPVYAANVQFEESMKILNKTLDASDPLYKDLVKRLKEVLDAAIKANKPLDEQTALFEDALKSLKEEQRALNLTERELYILQSTQELYNLAKREGKDVNENYIRTLEDEAGKTYDLIKAKEEESRANQQRMQELERLRDTIADTFMDGFEAAMEGGEEFKDWFEDLLKQLALQAIRNQIVIPIVGQFLGVNGGTAGMVQQGSGQAGGLSGVVSNIGSLFGGNSMGTMISDVGGWVGGSSPLAGTGAGNYISGVSANAANLANWQIAGGGMLGGVLSGALGLSGEYSAITGAAGTALGSSLLTPVLGPLAPLAGSFIGSALGGLIGNSEPSNKEGIATLGDISDPGTLRISGQTGKKFSQKNRDAAESIAAVISGNILGTLGSISGEQMTGQLITGVGDRDPLRFIYTDPTTGTTYGMGRLGSKTFDYDVSVTEYLKQQGIGTDGLKSKTRDINTYLDTVTTFFATMQGIDPTIYKDLADENELLIDSIKRVELQFSFVRGLFEDIGDSTEVTKEFADVWTDEFIKPLLDSEESLSEGMTRLAQQYSVVKSYTDLFGQSLGNTAQGILVATDNIIKASGGLEQFNAAASSYYQNFYSEEERFQHFATDLTNVFKDLGLELPTTTQGFRDLVEGLDLTKEADQALYATLLNLNPQVKQYIEGLESFGEGLESFDAALSQMIAPFKQRADEALEAVKQAVADQKVLIDDRYNSERDRLQGLLDQAQAAYDSQQEVFDQHQDHIDGLKRSLELLRDVYNSMVMDTFTANKMRRENAQALIRGAVSSGQTLSYDELQPALSTLQQPSQQYFSTFEDYARDFYQTKGLIGSLGDITEQSVSTEEKILQGMKDAAYKQVLYYTNMLEKLTIWYDSELSVLNRQLEDAQSMYDLVTGTKVSIEDGLANIVSAIDELRAALGSLSAANTASKQIETAVTGGSSLYVKPEAGDPISDAYMSIVGRAPDVEGYNYWKGVVESGVSISEVTKLMENSAKNFDKSGYTGAVPEAVIDYSIAKALGEAYVPGFADGGIHTGGWRIVGEEGPELEYTPPSRIYSNSDSSDMFDMSELVAEVKQLREDMRSANYAIAKNTQKTAKTLEKFDYDGLPEQRVV